MSKFSLKKTTSIGNKLGIDWSIISKKEWNYGVNVELEHGLENKSTNVTNDDAIMTGKIALAHINEIPDYYRRLKKMESEGKKYWKNK
jgi:hypothetical protein